MEKKPSLFLLTLKYALVIGLVSFIWGIITYITGWYTQNWVNYVGYIILIAGVLMVISYRRNRQLGGYITMGEAFSTGCLFSLLYGVIGVIGFLVTIQFIAPDMIGEILKVAEEQMIERGMSDSDIEVAMEWTRKFVTPLWMSITVVVFSLVVGGIVSFLASLFMKRTPPEA